MVSRFCFVTASMSGNWSHLLLHRLNSLSLLPQYHHYPRPLLGFRDRLAHAHQKSTGSEPLMPASMEAEAPLTCTAPADASLASSPRPVSFSDVCRNETSPPAIEYPKKFHDVMKTRSCRQVTLTENVRAAYR